MTRLSSSRPDGELRTWDATTRKLTDSLPAGGALTGNPANYLAYSADGSLVAYTYLKKLFVWDMLARKLRFEVEAELSLADPVFSPDGKTVLVTATPGSGGPQLYDAETGQLIARYTGGFDGNGGFSSIFLPDGKTILSAGHNGQLIAWSSPQQKRVLFQLPGAVLDLVLASDGRHLFTGNSNGTVYVLRLPAEVAPTL